jgi:ABC-type transport system involved in multi-copper enzyme maturation permease subunit
MNAPLRQRLAEAADRALNPILHREIRGTFRGTKFLLVLTGLLLVIAVALVVAIMAITSRTGIVSPAKVGASIHAVFLGVLSVAVLFILPAFAATSMVTEEEKNTRDMLRSTTLSEPSIVWGKFLAAMAYAVVFLFAALPLGSVSFLFGGVSVQNLVVSYVLLLVLASAVNMLAIFVSSQMRRSWTALSASTFFSVSAIILIGAVVGHGDLRPLRHDIHTLFGLPASLLDIEGFNAGFQGLPWWLAFILFPGYLYLAVLAFSFLSAVNRLKPWSGNRSTNIKLFYLLFLPTGGILSLITISLARMQAHSRPENLTLFYGSLGLFLILAAFFAAEDPKKDLAPRLHRWATGRRRLVFFLGPGAFRGYVFSFVVSGLTLALIFPFANRFLMPLAANANYQAGFDHGVAGVLVPTSVVLLAMVFLFSSAAFLSSRLLGNDKIRKALVSMLVVFILFAPLLGYGVAHEFKRIETASAHDLGFISPVVDTVRPQPWWEIETKADSVFPYRMTLGSWNPPVYAGFLVFAFVTGTLCLAGAFALRNSRRKP